MPNALPQVIISLAKDHGSLLASRFLGEELRDEVERLAETQDVTIDLRGVETMSPSFADEFFAKMPPDLLESGRVRVDHAAPTLVKIIRTVTAGRAPE